MNETEKCQHNNTNINKNKRIMTQNEKCKKRRMEDGWPKGKEEVEGKMERWKRGNNVRYRRMGRRKGAKE